VRWSEIDTIPCPVAQAMSVFGDAWTMLIIRDALRGSTRFEEFQRSTRASRAVVAERLARLVDHGVMEREQYEAHPPRYEYRDDIARSRSAAGADGDVALVRNAVTETDPIPPAAATRLAATHSHQLSPVRNAASPSRSRRSAMTGHAHQRQRLEASLRVQRASEETHLSIDRGLPVFCL